MVARACCGPSRVTAAMRSAPSSSKSLKIDLLERFCIGLGRGLRGLKGSYTGKDVPKETPGLLIEI